jgi:hypothetical protein
MVDNDRIGHYSLRGGIFHRVIRIKYAIESKLQAIELHLKGLGEFTIAKELNIGRSNIIRWVLHS